MGPLVERGTLHNVDTAKGLIVVGDILRDPQAMFYLIGIPAYCVLYVLGRFRYSIEGNRFVVRWSILGFLPIYRRSFPLDRLRCVRRFRWPRDFFSLATPLGNTFSSNRAIVEFSGWRRRSLAITPPSFDALATALAEYLPKDSGLPEGDGGERSPQR